MDLHAYLRRIGYRGALIHYLGMSHYYRLAPQAGGSLQVAEPAHLCGPAERWHAAYFALCAAQGYRPIASLSYELFAEHCPPEKRGYYTSFIQASVVGGFVLSVAVVLACRLLLPPDRAMPPVWRAECWAANWAKTCACWATTRPPWPTSRP